LQSLFNSSLKFLFLTQFYSRVKIRLLHFNKNSVMKINKSLSFKLLLFINISTFSQNNTFPFTGNVGIGTTSPFEKLTLQGEHIGTVFSLKSNGNGTNETEADLTLWASEPHLTYTGVGIGNNIKTWDNNTSTGGLFLRNPNRGGSFMRLLDNEIMFGLLSKTGVRNDVMYISNNNVGIGTPSPLYKLDVRGESFSQGHTIQSYSPVLTLKRNTAAGGYIQGIQTKLQNGTDNWFFGNLGDTRWTVSKGDYQSPKFTITYEGNVGIGTIDPRYKLDVNGHLSVKDYLYIQGADLRLGMQDGREQGTVLEQRALVHYLNDKLWLNFMGDFEGGTMIGNGAFIKNDGNTALQGKLEARELKITNSPTADFVFETNYNLPKLEEVEKHIKEKKHLPEIASAKEMEKQGVNVGEFQIKLLQKIEELTLYIIEQDKKNKKLELELEELKTKIIKQK
jgi:hypothetical protein